MFVALVPGAGERHLALGRPRRDRGGLEELGAQARRPVVRLGDEVHHRRRATRPGVGVAVVGHQPGQCLGAEELVPVPQDDVDAVVAPRDPVELLGEDLVLGGARVVQEGHLAVGPAVVPVAQEGADLRHHRRDAGAAGDHQQVVVGRGRRALGERELALRLAQVQDLAGLRLAHQELADPLLTGPLLLVGAHGDRELLARVGLGRGDREAPRRTPRPVDLDADLDVLPRAVSAPGAGRLQGDGRDRVLTGRLAGDVHDPRPDLGGGPHRVDLLEVAVHAVGRGERRECAGTEDAFGQRLSQRHAGLLSRLSEHVFTQKNGRCSTEGQGKPP